MFKKTLFFALLLLLGFSACEDNDPLTDGQMAYVTFAGQITDQNGMPIAEAMVKAGNESALTDVNGIFRLPQVQLQKNHALLHIQKEGYFEISKPYVVANNSVQNLSIQLLPKAWQGNLDNAQGGTITIFNLASLQFPANAVVDASGNPYVGTIQVYAQYLDPTDARLGLYMPGDMSAIDLNNDLVTLASYGMMGVELESPSGQKLQIAPGQEVEIRMPIQSSQWANAPAQIPLWYYDVAEGYWKEEGVAQKVGAEYVGKVKHFSFWNCDAPFPITTIQGKVYLRSTQNPLANVVVRLTVLSTGSSSFAYTDQMGCFGGGIPLNEAMLLEIYRDFSCGSSGQMYSQNIGPFSGPTTLPDIIVSTIPQAQTYQVSGSLKNCAGFAVSEGYVEVSLGGHSQFIFPDATGTFDASFVRCDNNPTSGTVVGYDLTDALQSDVISITTPPTSVQLGNIMVCKNLTEFIEYTLDGQSFTKVAPGGGLDVNFLFLSSNDSTNTHISIAVTSNGQLGTFPVTFMAVNQIQLNTMVNNNVNVTISEFGNVTEQMKGTFGGTFEDTNGGAHTISGSFQVIRDY